MRGLRREIVPVLLLAAAPVLAYAPAWRSGRLLAPGEGLALHLPLRVEVFRAYARGELPSWNPSAFSGSPLLAAYRPGALHPLMPALAWLPPLAAFQALVLLSLALTGPLAYAYARRLGADRAGALVAALSFALGPYLVAQLGDTATLVAAPGAAARAARARGAPRARGGAAAARRLALAVALVLLAGSPEACGALAWLAAARLALAALARRAPTAAGRTLAGRAAPWAIAAALAAGRAAGRAAARCPRSPRWREAGPGGAARARPGRARGAGGPRRALGLAHARRDLRARRGAARPRRARPAAWRSRSRWPALLGLAAGGRLDAPGAGRARARPRARARWPGCRSPRSGARGALPRGRRLRRLAILVALCSAAALSVATTVTGPLDPRLAAPVGLLALGLILYFTLAESPSPVDGRGLPAAARRVVPAPALGAAGLGRRAVPGASCSDGTPTRQAIDAAMGPRREERTLALAESRPGAAAAADLAWANLGDLRRPAQRQRPRPARARVTPARRSTAWAPTATLTRALLDSDPGRLELLGVRWLQVPTSALATTADADGLGDELDVVLEPPRPHLFALPFTRATEVRIVSFLAGATAVEQGRIVAECVARLANGREIWLPIRAGVDTAEWAWERADVRPLVRHAPAPRSTAAARRARASSGHEYRGVLRLPGRFAGDRAALPGLAGRAAALAAARRGSTTRRPAARRASRSPRRYASDEVRLAQAADTPLVSLFEVRRGIGPAWVVESLRRLPDEARVLDFLRSPTRLGIDARREALATEADAARPRAPGGQPLLGGRRGAGGRRPHRRAGGRPRPAGGRRRAGTRAGAPASTGTPARVLRVNADRLARGARPAALTGSCCATARAAVAGAVLALAALGGAGRVGGARARAAARV